MENFPGFPEGVDGYELMTRMQKQAERFGAKASFGTVEKVDFSKSPFELIVDGEKIEAETVIIATGASHKHLDVPGEDLLETKGVTYCATCDGALPVFRNQPLVVVGGGDSACEEALVSDAVRARSCIWCIAAIRCALPKSWPNAFTPTKPSSRSGIPP